MDELRSLFRWIHIVAGIVWIGHLYFFNFVNAPFGGTIDAATKKVVVPQLMPRALYWFRWGAAWTWVTGVLLAMLIFYHGWSAFMTGSTVGALLMIVVTFVVAPLVYDALAKSDLAKNPQTFAGVAFGLVVVAVLGFIYLGGFVYRAYVIHLGAMFGTIMAFNVWMRIWPAQQKIITATRDGQPPDAALVGLAGLRSRHNTYMSVPLVWTMIDEHTTSFAGSPIYLLAVVALGWWATSLLYKKAAAVKGF